MFTNDKVKVIVIHQGDAVCGPGGYLLKQSDDIAAFYLDGWGKTGRIYPISTCGWSRVGDKNIHCPSITIEDGEDNSSFTEIYFPEYEGWRVHCVSGGKTMSICLVKD